MPKIDTITLRCVDPEAQRRFYVDILGMELREDGSVLYNPTQARLVFESATHPYSLTNADTYWKIALSVPNIELAYQQLLAQGIEVSRPHQFRDVGYLAHFRDPEGFVIELIEHWFEGNRPVASCDTSRLGGGASLSLLTLRTNDIGLVREECKSWGMKPLSVQPVESHGFTLHFFAFTNDEPPNSDLEAVENREWLYQRPYTVLEIQEVHGAAPPVHTAPDAAGYFSTSFTQMTRAFSYDPLRIVGLSWDNA